MKVKVSKGAISAVKFVCTCSKSVTWDDDLVKAMVVFECSKIILQCDKKLKQKTATLSFTAAQTLILLLVNNSFEHPLTHVVREQVINPIRKHVNTTVNTVNSGVNGVFTDV